MSYQQGQPPQWPPPQGQPPTWYPPNQGWGSPQQPPQQRQPQPNTPYPQQSYPRDLHELVFTTIDENTFFRRVAQRDRRR